MKALRSLLPVVVCLAATVVAQQPAAGTQDKIRLRPVWKAGDKYRYTIEAVVAPEEGEQQFEFTLKMRMEDSVVKANADGTAEIESRMLGGTIVFGGQESEMPADTEVRKSKVSANCITLEISGVSTNDEFDKRLTRAVEPYLPDKELAIGETWKYEHKADAEKGWRGGIVTEKLLGIEVVDGIRVAKLEHKFQEKPFKDDVGRYDCTSTLWLELSNGLLVKGEGTVRGFRSPQMGTDVPLKMTIKVSRIK